MGVWRCGRAALPLDASARTIAPRDLIHHRVEDVCSLSAVDLTQRVDAVAKLRLRHHEIAMRLLHLPMTGLFFRDRKIACRHRHNTHDLRLRGTINAQLVAKAFLRPCTITQLQHG